MDRLYFGSSAVLANLPNGKRVLVAGQKSGVVTALDPDHGGEIVWQKRVGAGGKIGGVQWGIAADEAMSMSRCPTFGSASWRLKPLARNRRCSTQKSAFFTIARQAAGYRP